MSEQSTEIGDASRMHAALLDDPFGGTVCGASEGWRTQIAADVTCPACLADPRVSAPIGGGGHG